ncbi:MAG TPA: hypothetical protein VLK65_06070 [Vicinamibacteria bacterium]|nr:hypothetical protein [Vicinamibacteria bacterium]
MSKPSLVASPQHPKKRGESSTLSGIAPILRDDLFDQDRAHIHVPFGRSFQSECAVLFFSTRVTGFMPFDVAPDGRFLINTMPADATSRSSITVVVNLFASLEK